MKHVPIQSAEIRLAHARRFGHRCGRLLYFCPCAARHVDRGFTTPEIMVFRSRFGDAKRALGEMPLMECGHASLLACLAAAPGKGRKSP